MDEKQSLDTDICNERGHYLQFNSSHKQSALSEFAFWLCTSVVLQSDNHLRLPTDISLDWPKGPSRVLTGMPGRAPGPARCGPLFFIPVVNTALIVLHIELPLPFLTDAVPSLLSQKAMSLM